MGFKRKRKYRFLNNDGEGKEYCYAVSMKEAKARLAARIAGGEKSLEGYKPQKPYVTTHTEYNKRSRDKLKKEQGISIITVRNYEENRDKLFKYNATLKKKTEKARGEE